VVGHNFLRDALGHRFACVEESMVFGPCRSSRPGPHNRRDCAVSYATRPAKTCQNAQSPAPRSPNRQEAIVAVAIIVVIGLFFFGMGIYALAAPAALVRPFGITLAEPTSGSEVRAVYGGFGLAMAAVMALAAYGVYRTGIMITVAAALAGMALGRIVSAVVDAELRSTPTGFTA